MHRGLTRVPCPVCGKLVVENDINGLLRPHGPKEERCAGSGKSMVAFRLAEQHAAEHGG